MIGEICAHIHNYFDHAGYEDTYTIKDGAIALPFLVDGQYFRITGSRFNDGVFKYPADDLADETFTGTIYEMRPPKAFMKLVGEIEAWNEKYGETVKNPYASENVIGVYSYAKSGGDWKSLFGPQLNQYRRMG